MTANQLDVPLFATMGRVAEQSIGAFNAQKLANMAWAFAKADELDVPLYVTMGRAAERCIGVFNMQDFANTVWAFAVAGELAASLLDLISGLDFLEALNAKFRINVAHCEMSKKTKKNKKRWKKETKKKSIKKRG